MNRKLLICSLMILGLAGAGLQLYGKRLFAACSPYKCPVEHRFAPHLQPEEDAVEGEEEEKRSWFNTLG
jgi:hypothetical protein